MSFGQYFKKLKDNVSNRGGANKVKTVDTAGLMQNILRNHQGIKKAFAHNASQVSVPRSVRGKGVSRGGSGIGF